jgi:hypothetical protein
VASSRSKRRNSHSKRRNSRRHRSSRRSKRSLRSRYHVRVSRQGRHSRAALFAAQIASHHSRVICVTTICDVNHLPSNPAAVVCGGSDVDGCSCDTGDHSSSGNFAVEDVEAPSITKRRSYGSYHPLSLSPFIQAGQQAAPCAGHQGETSYVSSCCLPPTQTASSRRHGVRSTRYRKPGLGFVNSFGVTQGSLSAPWDSACAFSGKSARYF